MNKIERRHSPAITPRAARSRIAPMCTSLFCAALLWLWTEPEAQAQTTANTTRFTIEENGRLMIEEDLAPMFYGDEFGGGLELEDQTQTLGGIRIECLHTIPGNFVDFCNFEAEVSLHNVVASDDSPGSVDFNIRFMTRDEAMDWAWGRLPSLGVPVDASSEAEVEDFLGEGQVFVQLAMHAPTLWVMADAHVIARRTSGPEWIDAGCHNTTSGVVCAFDVGPDRAEFDARFGVRGLRLVATAVLSVGTDDNGQPTVGIERVVDVLNESEFYPYVNIDGDSLEVDGGIGGFADSLRSALNATPTLKPIFEKFIWQDVVVDTIEDTISGTPQYDPNIVNGVQAIMDLSLQATLELPSSTIAFNQTMMSVDFVPRSLSTVNNTLLVDIGVTPRLISPVRATVDPVSSTPFNLRAPFGIESEASLVFGPPLLANMVRELARGGIFSRTVPITLPDGTRVNLDIRPSGKAPEARFQTSEDRAAGPVQLEIELEGQHPGGTVRAAVILDGTFNDVCSTGVELVITRARVPGSLVWTGLRPPGIDDAVVLRDLQVAMNEAVLQPPIVAALTGKNARRIPLLAANLSFADQDVHVGRVSATSTAMTVQLDAGEASTGTPQQCRSSLQNWAESLLPINRIIRIIRGDIDPMPILVRTVRESLDELIRGRLFDQSVQSPISLLGGLMDSIVRFSPRGTSQVSAIPPVSGAAGAVRVVIPWQASVQIKLPWAPNFRYDNIRADLVLEYDAIPGPTGAIDDLRSRSAGLTNVSLWYASSSLLSALGKGLNDALVASIPFMPIAPPF